VTAADVVDLEEAVAQDARELLRRQCPFQVKLVEVVSVNW
jgi:hypothetical protein